MERGKTKTLWLDCQAGIAGDMFVAALLDVAEDRAAAEAAVRDALASMPVDGFAIEVGRVAKAGLDCCDFNVVLDAAHENHDHNMAYLHGDRHDHVHVHGDEVCHDHVHACEDGAFHDHAHDCDCGHHHDHEHHEHWHHEHDHDHGHGHEHGHHHHGHGDHHEHRGLADIEALLAAARLTDGARAFALRTFRILAAAEAEAHGVPLDQVHFHEVGAIDSIADIVAASVLVDLLGIGRAYVPVLTDGHGTIRCQHGVIPVPVPATLNICRENGLPLSVCEVEGELVTPTGAALVAALSPVLDLPERYIVRRVGLGAGKRTYSRPSILRVLLIEPRSSAPKQNLSTETEAPQRIVKLECDIDDATGEELGYAAEILREAGAREVHWLPIFTKKGRPAYQLQAICLPGEVEFFESIIFNELPTLGIRHCAMERTVLKRERETVKTPFGRIAVKVATLPDGTERFTPECDECAELARKTGMSLREVMNMVICASRPQ